MPRSRSRLPGCMLAVSLILVLCLILTALLVIVFDRPSERNLAVSLQRTAYAGYLRLRASALDQPAGDPMALAEITVLPGESAETVIQRLATAGLVADPLLLRAYLRVEGLDTEVQAGRYALSGQMTPRQMAEALQLGLAPQSRLTVVEGWRLEQIAESLPPAHPNLTAQAFMEATSTDNVLQATLGITAPSLEGFLFPDTYALSDATTAEDLARAMVERFDSQVDAQARAAFEARGLSLLQAVTLASIVEREAIVPEERPLIAGVFLNRLSAGMPLEADPTVQYAVGKQADGSWWKRSLTFDDLAVPSPYNTYQVAGLPPAPIANPGLASLLAVANPADTAALFFRAACDGSGRHAFAETFEEHLENACP